MRWNDSILLIGYGTDGKRASSWYMKLDNDGSRVWEKVGSEVPIGSVVEFENQGLILVQGEADGSTTVFRIDSDFKIATRRFMGRSSAFYVALRSTEPVSNFRLIVYGAADKPQLHVLNKNLQDEQPVTTIEPIEIIRHGCGYTLNDNTLALFGNVLADKNGYMAAVAHFGPGGRTAARVMEPPGPDAPSSYSVVDALSLSPTRFLAVRDRASVRGESSVVLSWVRFE
jgi:hypothetical protein